MASAFQYPLDGSTSVVIGGVNCWDEGGTESLSALNPAATRTILCNWADRTSLIPALGGGYDPAIGLYVTPLPHPVYSWLYPQKIDVEGIVGQNGMTADTVANQEVAGYQWARLTIRYGRYNFDPNLIQQGDIAIDYGVTVTKLPVGGGPLFEYYDPNTGNYLANVPVEDQPAQFVPTATLTLTRFNCQAAATGLSFSLTGRVNAAAIFGADPGTLRCDGVSSEKAVTLGGANNWTNRIRLTWNGIGWNNLWKPDVSADGSGGQYLPIRSKLGGQPFFPIADFSPLNGFL